MEVTMKVLVLGASGATGKETVMQLLKKGIATRVLIRESSKLPDEISNNPLTEIRKGNVHELTDSDLKTLIHNCDTIISCLGHNLTLKGLFGQPHYLVYDTVRNICETIQKNENETVKLILMNTTGYTNKLLSEKRSIIEKVINRLLMNCLPPHRDNMKAADYLVNKIGRGDVNIEWVSVRPDSLIDSNSVSAYEIHESTIRSPILNAGKTSRINVGHFMAELATDEVLWKKWVYQTPVIYNKEGGKI
jgi:nucleoside-diphosphate-sugar epimerase